ncbi:hypothetical protein [Xanthomonas arboricola]|uniref:hypothetical protein n=1 Tax=Xanthomonas arboricola TaxID=56448 RepID=UPI001189B247|nr:hypothetical protein [Xanthomonas arboricola]QDS15162.1 hypothetical protein FPL04_05560 [Xanthomonas arboricola]
MSSGVLVDTSFLISFVDKTQPYHSEAMSYYRSAVEGKILLYLSSLVVAEFSRKQDITNLPFKTFLPAPFNLPEGRLAAQIANLVNAKKTTDDKQRVGVDVMLIAQAEMMEDVKAVITADTNTLVKFAGQARTHGVVKKGVVDICKGFYYQRLADPFYIPVPPAVVVPPTPAPLI